DQRVLSEFLGEPDVVHEPGQPADDPRRLQFPDGVDRAADIGHRNQPPKTCWIVLSPSPTILRKRRPSSIASSLVPTSIRAKPAAASLASANGPSVTVISSP